MKSSKGTTLPTPSAWKSPYLQIMYRVIIWSPWIWLSLFATFVLITSLQIGHLPTYGQPDPKDAGLGTLFYMPTIVLLISVIGTTPVGIVLTLIKLWKGFLQSIRWREVIFYLGGLGLFYLFVMSDVVGLITWLAD